MNIKNQELCLVGWIQVGQPSTNPQNPGCIVCATQWAYLNWLFEQGKKTNGAGRNAVPPLFDNPADTNYRF